MANSPHFTYRRRHFPGVVRRVLSSNPAYATFGLFKGGDEGLANADYVFWSLNQMSAGYTASAYAGSAGSISVDITSPLSPAERAEPYAVANPYPYNVLFGTQFDGSNIVEDPPTFSRGILATLTEIVYFTDLNRYGLTLSITGEGGYYNTPTTREAVFSYNDSFGLGASTDVTNPYLDIKVWSYDGLTTGNLDFDFYNYP